MNKNSSIIKIIKQTFLKYLTFEFRFRAGVKDLEVMMTNVITSAFDTVTNVEQGVELLDIFMHLSSREVSRECLSLTKCVV